MPLSNRLRGHPPFFWLALAVGTALFTLYPFATSVLVRAGGRETDFGWQADRDASGRLTISDVTPGGPAEGRLAIGDLLRSINGQPEIGRGLGWLVFMDFRPGDRYRVGIEHNGNALEHELTVASRSTLQKVWLIQVPLLVVSFAFFVSGLGVALMSPRARVAQLYAALALVVARCSFPEACFSATCSTAALESCSWPSRA